MYVTFILHATCGLCGMRNRGVEVAQVRVNKRTLRSVAPSIVAFPWRCDECQWPTQDYPVQIVALNPESTLKVRAFRERKGWAA